MNIEIITHNLIKGDGQGRVNLEVALSALRRGHSLILIATRVADELAEHSSVNWDRVEVKGWPSQLVRDQVFAMQSSLRARAHNPDVVMACGYTTWVSTDLNAVHFVHRAWWDSSAHTRRFQRGPYAWYHATNTAVNIHLERAVLARTRAVAAVSTLVAEQLAPVLTDSVPVHVVPNGVDAEEFYPGEEERAPLGLPEKPPLALFVGDARSPTKNLDGVLRALAHVSTLHLAVAGDVQESPYPALAEQLGVASRVHFLGFRRDVAQLMRASDMFVLPSRHDSCPLVLLEAMASGLPIVTARTVGTVAPIAPLCGYVIPSPDDTAELSSALSVLTRDPQLRAQMGEASRFIAEQHSFRAMGDAYVDLLEALAESRSGQMAISELERETRGLSGTRLATMKKTLGHGRV